MRRLAAPALCLAACTGAPTADTGAASTSSDASSSGNGSTTSTDTPTTASTTDAPAECFTEVWRWTDPSLSIVPQAAQVRSGAYVVAMGSNQKDNFLFALTPDGELVWGPHPIVTPSDLVSVYDSALVAAADGAVIAAVSGHGGAWAQRWSPAGDPDAAIAVPGGRLRVETAALASTGELVLGGWLADPAGESSHAGEAVLLALSPDGSLLWQVAPPFEGVLAMTIDPSGTIFTLTGELYIEGGDVHVQAYAADGSPLWSELGGSNTGFTMTGPLTPFALTLDEAGGIYTLGHEYTLETPGSPPSQRLLLTRHDASGTQLWQSKVAVPTSPTRGWLALAGADALVWAVSEHPGLRIGLHRPGGAHVCDQTLADLRHITAMTAAGPGEALLAGAQDSGGPIYVAKYRALQ